MKKFLCVLVMGLMACSVCFAGESEVVYEVDGQKILGTLTMPENAKNVPAVLMLHGFTATRDESKSEFVPEGLFGRMSRELEKQGIASLRIDMRGSGKSEGKFVDLTVESEIKDALAGLEYLNGLEEVDKSKISVMGLSLGGIVTTATAGRSTLPIRSVVLWNPGINPPAAFITMFGNENILKAVQDENAVITLPLGDLQLDLKGEFYRSLYRVVPAAELANYSGPVLLAIGTKDNIVWPQPTSAKALLSYHKGEHELFAKDCGHVFDCESTSEIADEVIAKSVSFIVEHNK